MQFRPLLVFSTVATLMVGWFATRMWNGSSHAVWCASAMMAGWAPVLAAVMVAYVARVGPREDSVAAAWLVRAIGMHCVLLWMVGASDWLRGPPDAAPAWNADLGTPVVFVAFAPCFALCHALARWLLATQRRLAHGAAPPSPRPAEAPYRGLRTSPLAPAAPAAHPGSAGLVALAGLALFARDPSFATLPLTAAALGFAAHARTLGPGVGALVGLSALPLLRADAPLAMRWPLAALAALTVFLGASELRARVSAMTPRAA